MAGVETILGFRGAGKSTLARLLCKSDPRLIVCDTTAEYSHELHWVPETQPDVLRDTVLSGKPFRAAFVPNSLEEVQWLEKLAASQHDITLLMDEIDVWYEHSTANLGEGLSWMAKTGRHYNQRVVAISRIASMMPVQLRAEGVMWVFPLRHAGTRREIRNCTEMSFDPISLEVLEADGDRVMRTQVARISGARLQVLEFDTRTGLLYDRVAPEPAVENLTDNAENDADPGEKPDELRTDEPCHEPAES